MTHPDAVAAALARLATGTAPSGTPYGRTTGRASPLRSEPDPPLERVVATAEAALDELSTAAAFVAGGGDERLRRAVEAASAPEGASSSVSASHREESVAARGRTVLAQLERLRAAADGEAEPATTAADHSPSGDYFHCGRTTLLKRGGVASE